MRVVLTGGPSAGKTTIAEAIARANYHRLNFVPEGASILFRGGFPRETSAAALMCQQKAIYHVQRELEEIKALDQSVSASICDRGTLDGLAYWPGSEEEFFLQVGTNRQKELQRYDWVIHLDTAGSTFYQHSPIRIESFAEASQINERVKQAWQGHPKRLIITNNKDFSVKITTVLILVKMILDGESQSAIEKIAME